MFNFVKRIICLQQYSKPQPLRPAWPFWLNGSWNQWLWVRVSLEPLIFKISRLFRVCFWLLHDMLRIRRVMFIIVQCFLLHFHQKHQLIVRRLLLLYPVIFHVDWSIHKHLSSYSQVVLYMDAHKHIYVHAWQGHNGRLGLWRFNDPSSVYYRFL